MILFDTNLLKFAMKFFAPFSLGSLMLICGCVSPYEAGQRDARQDIAHGVLAIEAFGTPRENFPDYEKLLKENYGIAIRWVASNDVPVRVLEHWKGYNEVSKVEIERKFGSNVLQQTQTEALDLRARKNQSH
jgi:hypothetical protein